MPLLEAAGHRVEAPDLPGHGADPTPLSELSMEACGAFVAESASGAGEPIVLVGHSMAGAVISWAAERVPQAIRRLVYLTAYIPRSGESLASLARRDTEPETRSERVEIDGTECFRIPKDAARYAFYQDADDPTFDMAFDRIEPEPVHVFWEKADFTEEKFGRVSRAYIHCAQDKAIGLALQQEMVEATYCDPLFTLDGVHSPFLTAPDALAQILLSLGE